MIEAARIEEFESDRKDEPSSSNQVLSNMSIKEAAFIQEFVDQYLG